MTIALDTYQPHVPPTSDFRVGTLQNTIGGVPGTQILANHVNDLFYAIDNVLKSAGKNPNNKLESASNSQFLDALNILFEKKLTYQLPSLITKQGTFLQSDGSNYIETKYTFPETAAGNQNKILATNDSAGEQLAFKNTIDTIADNTIALSKIAKGVSNSVLAFDSQGTPISTKLNTAFFTSGGLNGAVITDRSIGTSKYIENSVDNFALAANSVNNAQLNGRVVLGRNISTYTIIENNLASGSVINRIIGDRQVTESKVATHTLRSNNIATNYIPNYLENKRMNRTHTYGGVTFDGGNYGILCSLILNAKTKRIYISKTGNYNIYSGTSVDITDNNRYAKVQNTILHFKVEVIVDHILEDFWGDTSINETPQKFIYLRNLNNNQVRESYLRIDSISNSNVIFSIHDDSDIEGITILGNHVTN